MADIAGDVETVHGAPRTPQRVAILARRRFALEFEVDSAVEDVKPLVDIVHVLGMCARVFRHPLLGDRKQAPGLMGL